MYFFSAIFHFVSFHDYVLYLTEMLLSENVVEAWPSFTFTDPNFSLAEGHTRQCQEEKLEMWFKELHTQCQLVILNVVIFLETTE